ncbi:hypothetical protein LCGC14_0102590 [marine sediment metagenome]|uniref:Uncharacterized protein n=1 Tax=marine sediment metagenome TaxID=412755 RepID=A0A0F9YEE6_9ZZZZ
MRKISPKIWIPAIVTILIVVGLAIFFAWPEKEEISEEINAPEVTPAEEEITPPPGIIWNVPAGKIDPEVEKEIKEAIYNNEDFISMGNALKEKGQFVSIEQLNMTEEWAVIGTAARFESTREYIGTEGVAFLFRRMNQAWEIAWEGDERFCQWLLLVPDTLISQKNKEFYQMFCTKD